MAGNRLPGIQALRGLSALIVFVHHIEVFSAPVVQTPSLGYLNLGDLGVDTFFAISGYLMASKSADPPLKFAIDRVRRILPGLWIALVISALVSWRIAGELRLDASMLLLLPLGTSPSTLVPIWTLYYEAAFYGLVWIAILVAGRWSTWVIIIALVVSFIAAERPYVWTVVAVPSVSHLSMSLLSVFFLAGVLVRRINVSLTATEAALLGVIGILLFYSDRLIPGWVWTEGPHLSFVVWALSISCILAAAENWPAGGFVGRALQRVGNASYGIYLIHIAALSFIVYEMKKFDTDGWPSWLTATLIVCPSLLLAYCFGSGEWALQGALKLLERRVITSLSRRLHHVRTSQGPDPVGPHSE